MHINNNQFYSIKFPNCMSKMTTMKHFSFIFYRCSVFVRSLDVRTLGGGGGSAKSDLDVRVTPGALTPETTPMFLQSTE